MTTAEIKQYLENHIKYVNGYDITKGPFPLPANIGEGFEFALDGKQYITHADNRVDHYNGKRRLSFEITSFIGLCGGAKHYYCKVCSYMCNVDKNNPSSFISGYLDGIEIPSESRNLEFNLGVPLTEEMQKDDFDRYELYEIGECAPAIMDKKMFFDIIEFLRENVFDMNEWEFEVK